MRGFLFATKGTPAYNPEAARAECQRIREIGVDPGQADLLECKLAEAEEKWGRLAELAVDAIPWWEQRGWPGAAASSRFSAGRAFLELGDLDRAEEMLAPALDYFKQWGPEEKQALVYKLQAALFHKRGRHAEAWDSIKHAMDGFEDLLRQTGSLDNEQAYLQDKAGLYRDALLIALGLGGREGCLRAWDVAERAKSYFLSLLLTNADVPLFRGVDPDRLAQLRKLDQQLDALEKQQTRSRQPCSQTQADGSTENPRQSLSDERRTLFDQISRDNPHWAMVHRPKEVRIIDELEQLGPEWTALSYFWVPRDAGATLHCFFMGRDRAPRHIAVEWSQAELNQLDSDAKRLRGNVPEDVTILPDELASKVLPEELLNSLWTEGPGPEPCLLISPHERLQEFPIHALPADAETLLIERFPVQYIPSLALLPFARCGGSRTDAATSRSALLIGCEQDGFRDPQLKAVPGEIEGIGGHWGSAPGDRAVSCLLEPQDTLQGAGVPLETWGAYEYVHIACHGFFPDDRPLDASLRLGSEAVRMNRFFQVSLKARLASLSASHWGVTREAAMRWRFPARSGWDFTFRFSTPAPAPSWRASGMRIRRRPRPLWSRCTPRSSPANRPRGPIRARRSRS